MSSNLVPVPVAEAAPVVDLFTKERIDLIRKTIANDAPDLEFEMFIEAAKHYGLDPVARQIYFIQRGGKWQWQASIDGFRLIASRTGAYVGSDDYHYDTETAPHPNKATVTVYRLVKGQRCPFTASARWAEYYAAKSPMWQRMPYLMLGKCAESLALRKAFPAELSGLYSEDEMGQAGPPDQIARTASPSSGVPVAKVTAGGASSAALATFRMLAQQRGWDEAALDRLAQVDWQAPSLAAMPADDLSVLANQFLSSTKEQLDGLWLRLHPDAGPVQEAELVIQSGTALTEAGLIDVATGEIVQPALDNRLLDFETKIRDAKTRRDLAAVGQEIAQAGIKDEQLREVFRRADKALELQGR